MNPFNKIDEFILNKIFQRIVIWSQINWQIDNFIICKKYLIPFLLILECLMTLYRFIDYSKITNLNIVIMGLVGLIWVFMLYRIVIIGENSVKQNTINVNIINMFMLRILLFVITIFDIFMIYMLFFQVEGPINRLSIIGTLTLWLGLVILNFASCTPLPSSKVKGLVKAKKVGELKTVTETT